MTKQPDIGNNNCIPKRYLEIIISHIFLPKLYYFLKKIPSLGSTQHGHPLSLVA